ncbi:hypothetical protein KKA66_00940 [Patescibacteria group bacterium]|nr:hypothetical protein [Patescibacteria group bacterium]
MTNDQLDDGLVGNGFGYSKRDNQRSKELHSTLSCKKYNAQNLKLSVEKDKIRVKGDKRRLNIYWNMESVKNKFEAKLPALVYVLANRKIIDGNEYFHFDKAYLLDDFDFEIFKKRVRNDDIVVDFRLYYRPNGSVRNHGTGFRVKINKLDDCFKNKTKLI